MRRRHLYVCTFALLASATAFGCGHSEKTTIRRETVQTVPPPTVVERRTTVEAVPAPPIVEQRSTTVRSGSVEHTIETTE
jgi:hypothetical protein